MTRVGNKFLRLAGLCAMLAPLPLLAGSAMQIAGGFGFEWTLAYWLSFVLFVPAVFGLTYLVARGGSRLGLWGGAAAFAGCMAGASMQVLFRVWAVLDEAGSPQTISLLQGSRKLIASTQMIGIFFPLGLLILAASTYRSRAASPLVALLLAAGAILFPVGRIGGSPYAFIASDLLLLAAFVMIGGRLLSARAD
jgi:cation transport ATPase